MYAFPLVNTQGTLSRSWRKPFGIAPRSRVLSCRASRWGTLPLRLSRPVVVRSDSRLFSLSREASRAQLWWEKDADVWVDVNSPTALEEARSEERR